MTWNYRIVKYANGGGYGLHEVHYNEQGKEELMTSEPAGFVGDTAEEIKEALIMAKTDIIRRQIFNEPDDWE